MKKIEKTFEEEIKGMRKYQTPGTPGFRIVKPTEDEPILESDMQSRYRTGVGMLMYLIKHSRPDIMNACRELTKVATRYLHNSSVQRNAALRQVRL